MGAGCGKLPGDAAGLVPAPDSPQRRRVTDWQFRGVSFKQRHLGFKWQGAEHHQRHASTAVVASMEVSELGRQFCGIATQGGAVTGMTVAGGVPFTTQAT